MTSSAKALPWYFAPMLVLTCGCIVAIINFGVRSTFGLFTLPVSESYVWPREVFSLAIAVQNLVWGIATPVAGMLADRFGAARVIIAGAALYAAGVFLMSVAATPFLFHVAGGVIVGAGIALSSFSLVMAALGRIVPPDRRSWAFGLATASGSLGQFVFAPLAGALLPAFQWQTTLVILACLTLLIIPFALPLFAQKNNSAMPGVEETSLSMTQAISQAFESSSYLLLVSGFFVCGFQLAFVTVHLPPYLAEHGITKEFAGLAMGFIGLFNVAGSYVAGIIGGKGSKRVPLAVIYLLRSLAVAAFISLPITPLTTICFAATLGFLWLSTVPLTMGLVTVMFGTRYMATLYGFIFLGHQVGSFLGVWLGGKLYDIYGTYDPVWWLGMALGLFALLVHLPIAEKRAQGFAPA